MDDGTIYDWIVEDEGPVDLDEAERLFGKLTDFSSKVYLDKIRRPVVVYPCS